MLKYACMHENKIKIINFGMDQSTFLAKKIKWNGPTWQWSGSGRDCLGADGHESIHYYEKFS